MKSDFAACPNTYIVALKKALTNDKGQAENKRLNVLINRDLFYEIEEKLGAITDFEIVEKEKGLELHYKSNGIERIIYALNSDGFKKELLQCYLYCASEFSYKPLI